ncbi:MAG: hypothetical protein E7076_07850, partial [Bacteroidales bacterium]|nr:hypothetical protein [Bacteroidales bacterium]
MKTLVRNLGKTCRRWFFALSLAWVGIGMAGAAASSSITDASRKYIWNGNSWSGYSTQYGMSASFNNNEVTLTNRGYSEGNNSEGINGQYNSGDYHVMVRAKSTQNDAQIGVALTGNQGGNMFTYANYTTVTTEYAYYDLGACNTFDGRTDYKFGFVIDTYTAPITVSEVFVTNNPSLYSGGPSIAAPTNVSATANSASAITVSWDAVSGADSYTLYYSNDTQIASG